MPQLSVDYVRLLIADLPEDTDDRLLTDEQLQTLIDEEGDDKLAAAAALDIIATSEVLVSKKIRTQDLQTDGPAVATVLREQAATLRTQVDMAGFDVVDFDPTVL